LQEDAERVGYDVPSSLSWRHDATDDEAAADSGLSYFCGMDDSERAEHDARSGS
jgi:hypothetical protein